MLDQRQRDLLGLALVAVGVYLGLVLYGHGDGGSVGGRLADALSWAVGIVRDGVPVALVLGGAALLLRPVLPALRPLRTGTLCLFAAVTLALAAGTFGLGPPGVRHGFWHPDYFKPRGGIVGEALFWGSHHLVSTLGADVLAVFLFVAGMLLLTGASVSSLVRATAPGWSIRRASCASMRPRAPRRSPAVRA